MLTLLIEVVAACERERKTVFAGVFSRFLGDALLFFEGIIVIFRSIFLNRAHQVLGYHLVSTGGVAGTVADPKIIFAAALKACASGIILAHNHPSGNKQPSQSDIDLTKKCVQAGRFLELQVLDHMIITTEGYFSFSDEGII